MVRSFALRLFGVPTLLTTKGTLTFGAERPCQLLCVLACRRSWMRRDELAGLLWPAQDASKARSNLRKVLLLAGELCGEHAIERQGDLLRWLPSSDLEAFDAACDEQRYAEAIELGALVLMEGLDSVFVEAAADWLLAERRRVLERWQAACVQQLFSLTGQPRAIASLATRMLARDPLDETAVEALARAQMGMGENELAARTLERFRDLLREELRTEPSAALRELDVALRTSRPMPLMAMTAPALEFVGRRLELSHIVDLFERDAVREVTVTGPGGIGKSAIARRVVAQMDASGAEPVPWVALADLVDADQVPARLASALKVELEGSTDAWAQIAAAIGTGALLMVLDNAEHLDLTSRLATLLSAAPGLKLLVTSRSALGLPSEAVLALDGLHVPDADETDIEVLRRCDSVILFEARARAVAPAFDLQAQCADVVRLLQLVEGMPLAIELSSAWTRLLPVAEIAAELSGSLDVLDGSIVASERGVRASFLQSWNRLANAERDSLQRLAQLPGDFGREMASQVASTPLTMLASLIDKSLLRSDGQGRFSMHLLLRRCASEQEGDGNEPIAEQHAAFMASWLATYATPGAPLPPEVVNRMESELAHVRAAWDRAVMQRDRSKLSSMARAVGYFHEIQGTAAEGVAALQAAARALDTASDDESGAAARVWRALGALHYRASDLPAAEMAGRRAVQLASQLNDTLLIMSALNTLGMSLWQRGEMHEARSIMADALQRATDLGDEHAISTFVGNIARIDKSAGDYERALDGFSRAIAIERRIGAWFGLPSTLNSAANVYRALGRPAEAIRLLNEALLITNQHSLRSVRCIVLINLGMLEGDLGHPDVAREWLRRGLDESRQWGEPMFEMVGLLEQAHLDILDRAFDSARAAIWQALALADRSQSAASQVECVAAFGELLAYQGQMEDGIALMRWAMAQPTLDRLDRDIVARRLDAIERRGAPAPKVTDLAPDAPLVEVLARVPSR